MYAKLRHLSCFWALWIIPETQNFQIQYLEFTYIFLHIPELWKPGTIDAFYKERRLLIWSGSSNPFRVTRDCRFPNLSPNKTAGVADGDLIKILNHWAGFFTWSLKGDLRYRKRASVFWTDSCIGWAQNRLQLNSCAAFYCDLENNGGSLSPIVPGICQHVSKANINRLGSRLPRQPKAWI